MSSQPRVQTGDKPHPIFNLETALDLMIGTAVIVMLWVLVTQTPLFIQLREAIAAKNAQTAWFASRATAIVAYLLLSASVGWGLVLSSKIVKEITPPPAVLAVHNAISWVAVGLAVLHAAALLFDTYYTYLVSDILIPFTGPYRPVWVGLGIISFYIMVLASMSFQWRQWLGQRNWRFVHYLTFPMYGMVTLHGFLSGTDSRGILVSLMYISSVVITLFLTNYRLLAGKTARQSRRSGTSSENGR